MCHNRGNFSRRNFFCSELDNAHSKSRIIEQLTPPTQPMASAVSRTARSFIVAFWNRSITVCHRIQYYSIPSVHLTRRIPYSTNIVSLISEIHRRTVIPHPQYTIRNTVTYANPTCNTMPTKRLRMWEKSNRPLLTSARDENEGE